MKRRRSSLLVPLLISLGVMVAALTGQTLIFLHASSALEDVRRIVDTGVGPALIALEAARGAVDGLQQRLTERLRGASRDRALLDADIDAGRRELRENLAAYLALPIFPGEPTVQTEMRSASENLDRVIRRLLETRELTHAAAEDPIRELEESATRLRAALSGAVEINAAIERTATAQLRSVRDVDLPEALLLDVVCAFAAVATLAITYKAVQKAERKAAELEAFAGRVAHDLMSPIMVVSLAIAAAEPCVSISDHPRAHKMLVRAGACLQRLGQTVTDVLNYARAGAEPSPDARADAQQILLQVASDLGPISDDAHVELKVEAAAQSRVRCAPGVLRSVISNLVQNAIKYIEGGTDRLVTLRAIDEGQEVRLEVEDTGPGIAPEDQEPIFAPYVRRREKEPGFGFGLATVKQLVEAHGGHVGVESEIGHGARFWVTLPSEA